MALSIRNLPLLIVAAVITHVNKVRLDLLKLRAGLIYHADVIPAAAVATANATDLTTSIALITALQVAYTAHIASACDPLTGIGAHIAADATNVLAAAVPTDLTTSETAANELKAQYNLHRVVTADHAVADATNAVSTTAAVDLATTVALANAVKVALNAHCAAAFNGQALVLVSA